MAAPRSHPSSASYSYYGTPNTGPGDLPPHPEMAEYPRSQELPFLAPTALNVPTGSLNSIHRDSGSTTPYLDEVSTPTNSAPLLPAGEYHDDPGYRQAAFGGGGGAYRDPNYGDPFPTRTPRHIKEEVGAYTDAARATRPIYKRPWFWLVAAVAVAVVVVAVVVPVVLVSHKDNKDTSGHSSSAASNGNSGSNGTGSGNTTSTGNTGAVRATTGGDGSTVTMEDGTTFVYHNSFGGFCECFFFLGFIVSPSHPVVCLQTFTCHCQRFLRFVCANTHALLLPSI